MSHITIRNQKLFCENCGNSYVLKFPLPTSDYANKLKAFSELHNDCEKTWVEPEANQEESIRDKAMWWISNGRVGMSSKTMWNFFLGNKNYPIDYPHDPDDFSRCYKLLQAVPEWKPRISELQSLSPQWKNLSDNWDKLTEMYEQNVKEQWVNSEKIGMYEFMSKLLL